MDKLVLPGDHLDSLIKKNNELNKKIVLGPGILVENKNRICSKAGILKTNKNSDIYWIDGVQKRYIAVKGERVLGIVASKGAFKVKVDIGTSEYAVLDLLAFEGATKKNKLDINIGDLVYARILVAGKYIETELVCVTSRGKREGMGVLSSDGYMFTVSINVVRKLLNPEFKLMELLGLKYKYEAAIGMNGRIWIKTATTHSTVFLVKLLSQIEYLDKNEITNFLKSLEGGFNLIKK